MSDFDYEIPVFPQPQQPQPQQPYVTYANILPPPSSLPAIRNVVTPPMVSRAAIFFPVKNTPENLALFKQAILEEAQQLNCWSSTEKGGDAEQQILKYCRDIAQNPYRYFLLRYSGNAGGIVLTIYNPNSKSTFEHYALRYEYDTISSTYYVTFNPDLFVDVVDKRLKFKHIYQIVDNLVQSGKYFQCFFK